MAHYKTMFDDSDMLFAHDLGGKEIVVQIARVYGDVITGEKGRKSKKPFVEFQGKKKRLALNRTNAKTVARMYGSDTSAWEGKLIALYPTTTEFGGETVECIRIRPQIPKQSASQPKADAQPDKAE